MMLLDKLRRHGLRGLAHKALTRIQKRTGFTTWRYRHAPRYANPTTAELVKIEQDLITLNIDVGSLTPSPDEFKKFQAEQWFPSGYHGGLQGGVWHEKLLEHWISSQRLNLMAYAADDIYVDVAAAGSPWAHALRTRKGLAAHAIDLGEFHGVYRGLPYYLIENACRTSFADASVKGASLHCAYEMFMGDDDTRFIHEVARILQPGGKVVILPLYMHTHYCAYASPDHYGKGYNDPAAREYIRLGSEGIPSSRKYDALQLKRRVLDPILSQGMRYRLLALRNKDDLGDNIYCHFILEIER